MTSPEAREALVQRVIDAEHRWCVEVEGEFALRHQPEAHRRQAEFVIRTAALSPAGPEERGGGLDVEIQRLRAIEVAAKAAADLPREPGAMNDLRHALGWHDLAARAPFGE